ncbi:MAG TPA: IclR family transcriptional regulator [Actinomycetes bacterium]|nr:IclR family transcriptional regulator [Actinomycetes bacterium]
MTELGTNRTSQRKTDPSSPQLLERTFAVLALFTSERREWTTTQIGRECQLPVPTTYRILAALERHGFVARDKLTKRFRLGPAALALGRNAEASTDLRTVSMPVLQRLSTQTGETTLLVVPSEDRLSTVCLERVESPQSLRLSVQPGRLLPFHAGAQQKAILAYMPADEQAQILAGPLEKFCKATIDDPDELRQELVSIRAKGWARSFEETDLGVWGVAMALLDDQGYGVASIGIAGPRARLERSSLTSWIKLLHVGVEDIAEQMRLRCSCSSTTGQPR